MKSDWQYVQINGTNEKMAPKTLVENVLTSENGPSLKEVMPSNPNLLINGDFQVWQRGTSFDASQHAYTADRWVIAYGPPITTVDKIVGGLRFANSGASSRPILRQYIENGVVTGKKYTISIGLVNGSVYSGTFDASESVLQIKYFYTSNSIALGYEASKGRYYFAIYVAVDAILDVAWCKLESGAIATPFIPRLYAEELAVCKRYYEKGYREYPSVSFSTTGFDVFLQYDVEKRIKPTVTFLPDDGYSNWRYYNNGYFVVGSIAKLDRSDNTRLIARCTKNSTDTTMAANCAYEAFGYWTADAEIY